MLLQTKVDEKNKI